MATSGETSEVPGKAGLEHQLSHLHTAGEGLAGSAEGPGEPNSHPVPIYPTLTLNQTRQSEEKGLRMKLTGESSCSSGFLY